MYPYMRIVADSSVAVPTMYRPLSRLLRNERKFSQVLAIGGTPVVYINLQLSDSNYFPAI
jgi:hypothetical protein